MVLLLPGVNTKPGSTDEANDLSRCGVGSNDHTGICRILWSLHSRMT